MNKKLEDINFVDILPESISKDETIGAAAKSLDSILVESKNGELTFDPGELRKTNDSIDNILIYSRIDELSAEFLAHLAWQFKTPYWDDSLPLEEKRKVIKQSIAWHKRRGTPSAVKDVISTVLGTGELIEWWNYPSTDKDYPGDPFHFKVSTEGVVGEDSYSTFFDGIESVKNQRSVLDSVITKKTKQEDIYVGVAMHRYSVKTLQAPEA
ncbi:MAG: phage tail protein I [Deltaproteobacteria bacterium]|nr:phage tail protein I [Deltaproteobacteria bacterium]